MDFNEIFRRCWWYPKEQHVFVDVSDSRGTLTFGRPGILVLLFYVTLFY